MNWFKKIVPSRINTEEPRPTRRSVPEGLWTKCEECNSVLYRAEVERNLYVCPKCGHHMRLTARQRLETFLDPGSGTEIGANVEPVDMLRFRDSKKYKDRLILAQKDTGEKDALVAMKGRLKGMCIVACAFEFKFMGGSMGAVVGERFVRAVTRPWRGAPLVSVSPPAAARACRKRFLPDADGQDQRRAGQAFAPGLPFISVDDRSDHGRRVREPRHAGRCERGRAQGTHRLCRSACH